MEMASRSYGYVAENRWTMAGKQTLYADHVLTNSLCHSYSYVHISLHTYTDTRICIIFVHMVHTYIYIALSSSFRHVTLRLISSNNQDFFYLYYSGIKF